MSARALIILIACAAPSSAAAFPELALRADTPACSSCHISPGGGGLLTEQGRDEAASTLSRGGDGRVFHGAFELPGWLLVGGDFRGAALVKDDALATERMELSAFPMQADLRLGVQYASFSVVATAGLRGSTRTYRGSDRGYVVSPEHYAMWSGSELYVRAGRFFPVQGLRLPDHTLYVRRFTGTNLFEEPYAVGVGYATTRWEVHATGFTHDPVLAVGRREHGAALHVEAHVEPATFAAFAGLDHQLAQGVQLLGWYEHFEEVMGLTASYHHGAGLALKLYPRAHWEIITHTRWQWIGTAERTAIGMLQLHYYL